MSGEDITVEELKSILNGHANINLENIRKYLSQDTFKKGTGKPSAYQLGYFEGYADAPNDMGADEKILKEVRSIIEPVVMSGLS